MVFTSAAFNSWVASRVNQEGNSAFNPYLIVLFYALCVFCLFPSVYLQIPNLSFYAVLVYQQSGSLDPHYTLSFDYSDYEKQILSRFVDPVFSWWVERASELPSFSSFLSVLIPLKNLLLLSFLKFIHSFFFQFIFIPFTHWIVIVKKNKIPRMPGMFV